MKVAELTPVYLLDEDWEFSNYVGPGGRFFGRRNLSKEEEEVLKWIRGTCIQIASIAETMIINGKADYKYLKTELRMNTVLPKGTIEEFRFKVALKGDGQLSEKVYAIDGFPRDKIEDKHIIEGNITIGINKLFKFVPIPVVGEVLPELQLGPWNFALGRLRRVEVDFSGPYTPTPEWYFNAEGIGKEMRVALIIAKHKSVQKIDADVRCAWVYNPGILQKLKLGTDEKLIQVYSPAK